MSFVAWIERHRRSLIFISFAVAIAGLFAGASLPVSLFPTVNFPRLRVVVTTSGMPAKQMLVEVTEPLEAVARAVPGATRVTSTTSRGSAELFIDFAWGSDMRQALLSVNAAFAQTLPELPKGTTYEAIRMRPTAVAPFLSYALISDKTSPAELRRIARYQIAPLLSGVSGVRQVNVLGGQTPEVQASIDPRKLESYGLTLDEVAKAVADANTVNVVGRLEDNDRLYLAVTDNRFDSAASVGAVVIRNAKGGIVRLSDIARVTMGAVPQWLLVEVNGRQAVTFDIYQQDAADSLVLEKEIAARLATFMKTQPQNIRLVKWYDQTALVRSSVAAVEEAIGIGLVFAALVILAFLRNWRIAAVAMLIAPLSVMVTVLLLHALGMSFNIMTLGGIAAAIGLLIDDVIVMIEHIARRAGAPGDAPAEDRVLGAAREFLSPLFGSSLATIVIFLPLAALSGVAGAFFKFLALTMTAALVISFILTAFTAPLLVRGIIDFAHWRDPAHGRETWLRRVHGRLLDRLFSAPWLVGLAAAALVGAGYLAYTRVGTGFLPRMDEGGFVIDYHTAPGTSLAETDRELRQIEAILKSDPHVSAFSRRTGAGFGGDFKESYQGDFIIRLVDPAHRPPIWSVMDAIDAKITSDVPGVSFDAHLLLGDMVGDMVGRPQPIVVELSAKNPETLPEVATALAAELAKVPGIEPASVESGVVPAGDALKFEVDRAAAAMAGMTPAEVEAQLLHYLNGKVVTRYLGSVQPVGVRLWLDPPGERMYKDQLSNLLIRAPNGHVFPLGTVAHVVFAGGQPEITRDNLAQIVAVTAQISGGSDLGSVAAAVKKVLDRPGLLPNDVYYRIGGAYKQQQIAAEGMIKVFIGALVAEFILLLFLYERFWLPVIIISTSLVATSAVFIGLWLTGVELNITAMMGMVMIIGVGTEMAVFLVSEYQALAETTTPREAIREASLNRLRPIVMSSLAMILALAPLGAAISGSGDQMLQPLAVAIIAGIVAQLPLVLLAMPALIRLTARRP
ncbi:efflux RND transporter permease subunit [Rhodoblastus sp.]|uniref:efflux RND transporter permease subunit n=1 Tax=Rhodoblastus sp. TaxID=1962975 RepID=UPI00260643DB|nr:efflux RND transporter permease subunit [Rhodoblastus sp.]